MRHITTSCALLLAACLHAAAQGGAAAPDAPVVEVLVAFQDADPMVPWQSSPVRDRRGFGILLSPDCILTTEALVRNQMLVEVRYPRSGEKLRANLLCADPQINLALLALGDNITHSPERNPALQPPFPGRETTGVRIIQVNTSSEVQQGGGRVVQWKMDTLPQSPYSALLATILSDLNIDAEGAPVMADGRIAGLVISFDPGTRTGQMLPVHFIRAFIEDVLTPPYRGFASAGFFWQPLVDGGKRRFLGIPAGSGGVQVLGVLPAPADTGEPPFKPNDVILEWDGMAIDSLGYYDDPDWGRLLFPYLVKGRGRTGDSVPVKLVRDHVLQTVQVVLQAFDDNSLLVPENPTGAPEPYLVEAGFVIRELTGSFLKAQGSRWQLRTDPRLVHYYLARQYAPVQPGDRVLMLSAVLPDPVNTGYQHLRDQIVTTVNGRPVRNLAEVLEVVDRDGGIELLGILDSGVDLAVSAAMLDEANRRIAVQYRIPAMRRPSAGTPVLSGNKDRKE